MNTSGIRPSEYNVLVKPKEVEEKTDGGLWLPEQAREKEEFARMEGTLIAASPAAFFFEGWPDNRADERPKVGDTVMFSRYAGERITGGDGATYFLMKDKAIIGVMEQ